MGELFAILSAVLFAIANITVSRGASAQSEDNGAFLSIVLTALLSGAMYTWGYSAKGVPAITSAGLYWFAAAGLLTVFLGRVLVYASVQYLGAVRASAVKRLNPFFAVLIAVLVLGEPLSAGLVVGMALIFSSFVLLIQQSLVGARRIEDAAIPERNLWRRTRRAFTTAGNLGYFYGPVSALSYAIGYVGRKQGLLEIPDPFFGTMVGAIVGVLAFLLTALFVNSYRTALRSALTRFNGWLLAAGVFSSLGQICTFIALDYTTISRVALISAMEVFITMFLSVWIFRSRERLGVAVVSAAAMGVLGTAFIVWE
jgi:drug/metabolite transporter (DMT)-like permease